MPEETAHAGQLIEPLSKAARPRILVIGLGNPILGDDGVGWHVCQSVQARLQASQDQPDETFLLGRHFSKDDLDDIEFDCLSLGGLALMERLVDSTHVLIIDAITTQAAPVGTVLCFPLQELPMLAIGHLASAHDTSLQHALQVGEMMGANLPKQITILGIEAHQVYDFSENLSAPVSAAITEASERVIQQLREWIVHPDKPKPIV
jgi:hydrogenase maturation protease